MADERHGEAAEAPFDVAVQAVAARMERVRTMRGGRPLLLLFYPTQAQIGWDDLARTYRVFREQGRVPEEPCPGLDVLVHTMGGLVDPAYQLALVIRLFADEVSCLVPEHAVSAGTLLCLGSNHIVMGHTATLGPLDITVGEGRDEVSLAAIEGLIDFAVTSQAELERRAEWGRDNLASTAVAKLIDELGAVNVGWLYRQRRLTEVYAEELMTRYMFTPPRWNRRDAYRMARRVARWLVHELPAHDFVIDVVRAGALGLPAERMPTPLYDATHDLVETLEQFSATLCPYRSDADRAPYIALHAVAVDPAPAGP